MFKFFFFFLFFSLQASAQTSSSSLIVGVGYGVFVIGFGSVVAIILCLIGRATRYPEYWFLFSLIIPIFLILFFFLAPKEAQRAQTEQEQFQTDGYVIPRYIYLVIFILTFIFTACCVCNLKYFVSLMAVRVGTVNQEDKDNFFDNEAPKPEEDEKNVGNMPPNVPPFEQSKSKDLAEFNVRSENVSFMGKPASIFKRKQNEGALEIQGGKK